MADVEAVILRRQRQDHQSCAVMRMQGASLPRVCVCFCVYGGLFDEVKAALVCLPGADEDLSRKGRRCLLLSHTNRQHTH